jgi:hypothetical protein
LDLSALYFLILRSRPQIGVSKDAWFETRACGALLTMRCLDLSALYFLILRSRPQIGVSKDAWFETRACGALLTMRDKRAVPSWRKIGP